GGTARVGGRLGGGRRGSAASTDVTCPRRTLATHTRFVPSAARPPVASYCPDLTTAPVRVSTRVSVLSPSLAAKTYRPTISISPGILLTATTSTTFPDSRSTFTRLPGTTVGAAAVRALVHAVVTATTPTSATLTRATAPFPKACVGRSSQPCVAGVFPDIVPPSASMSPSVVNRAEEAL